MAKLFASEAGRFCVEIVSHPRRLRLFQGVWIERLYRDAPLLLIGEGTSEIQAHGDRRKLLQRAQDLMVDAGAPIET